MITSFLFLCLATCLVMAFMYWGNEADEWYNFMASVVALIGGVVVLIVVLFYCGRCYDWVASEYKVNIINREYNTDYTREEIFYASDVIETIRNLNRNRHEINSNINIDNKNE